MSEIHSATIKSDIINIRTDLPMSMLVKLFAHIDGVPGGGNPSKELDKFLSGQMNDLQRAHLDQANKRGGSLGGESS